jgi:hypothetical protein
MGLVGQAFRQLLSWARLEPHMSYIGGLPLALFAFPSLPALCSFLWAMYDITPSVNSKTRELLVWNVADVEARWSRFEP